MKQVSPGNDLTSESLLISSVFFFLSCLLAEFLSFQGDDIHNCHNARVFRKKREISDKKEERETATAFKRKPSTLCFRKRRKTDAVSRFVIQAAGREIPSRPTYLQPSSSSHIEVAPRRGIYVYLVRELHSIHPVSPPTRWTAANATSRSSHVNVSRDHVVAPLPKVT